MRTTGVVVVVAVVVHLVASSNPYLLDNCIVNDEEKEVVKLSTFKDSVEFSIVAHSDKDVIVTITQGETNQVIQIKRVVQHVWLKAQLDLTGEPQLVLGNQTHTPRTAIEIKKGTRKDIEIANAHVMLECPEGWPNRELKKGDTADAIIALSEKGEESLILRPTMDTKVYFSVGSDTRILCRKDNDALALFNVSSTPECENLEQNTDTQLKLIYDEEDNTVKVVDADKDQELDTIQYTDKRLKFLRTNLSGSLYIVQCQQPCQSGSGLASSSVAPATTVLIVCMIILQFFDASVSFLSDSSASL